MNDKLYVLFVLLLSFSAFQFHMLLHCGGCSQAHSSVGASPTLSPRQRTHIDEANTDTDTILPRVRPVEARRSSGVLLLYAKLVNEYSLTQLGLDKRR
jgi:hypothetical protein